MVDLVEAAMVEQLIKIPSLTQLHLGLEVLRRLGLGIGQTGARRSKNEGNHMEARISLLPSSGLNYGLTMEKHLHAKSRAKDVCREYGAGRTA